MPWTVLTLGLDDVHLLTHTLDLQSLANGTSGVAVRGAAIPASQPLLVQELLAEEEGRILFLEIIHVPQPSWTI